MNKEPEDLKRKAHWETVYQTKELKDVSWFQPNPATSLEFVKQSNLPKSAAIIDIGAGDSFLVDHLLDMGYTNVSVLDISASALERAKKRLGKRSHHVKWIVSDILDFNPTERYDLWHDRAAFHFLTNNVQIANYESIAARALTEDGNLIIGTFSEIGPKKCSGLDTKQYNEVEMNAVFDKDFTKIKCISENHKTPSDSIQNFLFCSFKKKK
ncbi:MAG: class I SAM-dependent methyltransferase [bacterium]|nr:class I SAM-dependent methyltransferase [bacterium]